MTNSREFASLLGVSQSTVSRALNDSPLVPEEKRNYIKQKAKEHGFVLNSQARSLRTRKTGTIGILFPRYFYSLSTNLMFTHIYDNIQKELTRLDYDIMVIHENGDLMATNTFERIVKEGKVDGFINLRSHLSERELEIISKYSVPFVSLYSAKQENVLLNQFIIDTHHSGQLAGEYLGRFGWEKYMFVTTVINRPENSRRLAGYRAGLGKFGKTVGDEDVVECQFTVESAREEILKRASVFQSNHTAIFAYNDMLAIGVVNALNMLGVSIPQNVQIISMDDIPLASWQYPKLSTLRAPVEQMIKDGSGLLCRLIAGERIEAQNIAYKSELILRDTTMLL